MLEQENKGLNINNSSETEQNEIGKDLEDMYIGAIFKKNKLKSNTTSLMDSFLVLIILFGLCCILKELTTNHYLVAPVESVAKIFTIIARVLLFCHSIQFINSVETYFFAKKDYKVTKYELVEFIGDNDLHEQHFEIENNIEHVLERKIEELDTEFDETNRLLEEINRIEENSEIENNIEQVLKRKIEELDRELDELDRELEELEELDRELDKLDRELEEINRIEENKRLLKELAELNREIDKLNRELEENNRELEELNRELEEINRIEEINREI